MLYSPNNILDDKNRNWWSTILPTTRLTGLTDLQNNRTKQIYNSRQLSVLCMENSSLFACRKQSIEAPNKQYLVRRRGYWWPIAYISNNNILNNKISNTNKIASNKSVIPVCSSCLIVKNMTTNKRMIYVKGSM